MVINLIDNLNIQNFINNFRFGESCETNLNLKDSIIWKGYPANSIMRSEMFIKSKPLDGFWESKNLGCHRKCGKSKSLIRKFCIKDDPILSADCIGDELIEEKDCTNSDCPEEHWQLVFKQNLENVDSSSPKDTYLFASSQELFGLQNTDPNNPYKFSLLGILEQYRNNEGKFHFKLMYPGLSLQNYSFNNSIEWIQENGLELISPPQGFTKIEDNFGYLVQNIDPNHEFKGLGKNVGPYELESIIDGFPFSYNNQVTIGYKGNFENGNLRLFFEGPNGRLVKSVELYINPKPSKKKQFIIRGHNI